MSNFNLNNWVQMFNSADEAVAERTCNNVAVINDYLWGDKRPDQALKDELHQFNQFAVQHTGKPVYDETVPAMKSGVWDVGEYVLQLGRSR